ncbi:hypothetical protein M3Y97_00078600 [Aphelenchoides bicaudatus]|nr:hypothetical protein M3Y97_00078600 [Aphelenchoides bicaudatus]
MEERPTSSLGSPATTTSGSASNNFLQVPTKDGPLIEGRKRSGSVPVVKITLAVAWNLKTDYVRALKITWTRLCDVPRSNCRGILAIMDKVFEKFDQKDRHVKEVFYQAAFVDSMADCHGRRHSDNSIATLRDHVHFFVSLISQVINSLEKPPTDIFEHIDRIGSYHFHHLRQCGFRATMWDRLGVCLVDAISIQDCVRVFPEACKAWTIMIAALTDRLRSARKNFGFPLSLRGSNSSLNKATMLLNSVTISRSLISTPDGRRPSSPCISPLRRPNPDASFAKTPLEGSPKALKAAQKAPSNCELNIFV